MALPNDKDKGDGNVTMDVAGGSDPDRSSTGRKRRLSKKERKALKKQQQNHQQQIQSNQQQQQQQDQDCNKVTHRLEESKSLSEVMQSYVAIPIPSQPSREVSSNTSNNSSGGNRGTSQGGRHNDDDLECGSAGMTSGGKSLGKWFPNALRIKCSVNFTNTGKLITNHGTGFSIQGDDLVETKLKNPRASIALFYQYTEKSNKWTPHRVKILMTYLSTIAHKRNIGGRIRVSQEGVNATLSAVDMPTRNGLTAYETLRHVVQDLKNFDAVFEGTDFKFIDDLPADRHFKELRVIPVEELVFYGIREEDAACGEGGVHLDAVEYHEMLKKENAVVIDVRNHYEAVIGRFDGQQKARVGAVAATNASSQRGCSKGSSTDDNTDKVSQENESKETCGGAEYIDPKMRKSTDFTQWLAKDETREKLKNKTVLMFCTGGIRCERASAYLKKEMGNEVEGVYQLQGGIERYLQAFPDGGFWRGKNFVFDKREAVSAFDKDGDGGVIRKKNKKDKVNKEVGEDDLPAKCCVCSKKWDRYVGKKKCYTCGVPVLMCETCMSLKPDKTKGWELKVRCPLCVEENITVPASEVEFTENGVKSKKLNDDDDAADAAAADGLGSDKKRKAADSVLKWGGGHAKNKKLQRIAKRRLCQFGTECIRKNCIFAHPERDENNQVRS